MLKTPWIQVKRDGKQKEQKNQGHSERGKQRSSQDAVCRNRDTIQKEGAGREQKGVSKIGKGQRIRDEGRS
jgi:hypothetical protein